MSTPPPSPPTDPKEALRKEMINALIWAVLAAGLSVFLFIYANKPDNDRRNFYLITGAVAAIVAVVNGYSAWQAYEKTKPPVK